MKWQFGAATLFGGVFLLGLARLTLADDFRVETEVFVEKQAQPVSENLTLFSGATVYDFELTDPPKTTIFDTTRGQIVMLDPARQVRTIITRDQLLKFVAELQARASEDGSRLKPFADPKFTTTFDAASNRLTLAGDVLTYNVKGLEAKDPAAVLRYREFADWSARLNSTRPDSFLPFARLALNRELAERKLVPAEVELTLAGDNPLAPKRTFKSKQTFTWRLLESDQQKINQAAEQATSYKLVNLREFRQFNRLAERPK